MYRKLPPPVQNVAHVFTNEEGKYTISVPMGEPITVRFDTHHSMTNAGDWHPSVVANVDAMHALAAYQFCAMWTTEGLEPEYAESAVRRLGPFKLTTRVLQDIRQVLQEHFVKQIKAQP
jgi:hypothetical protein